MIVNRAENLEYYCLWTSGFVEKRTKTYNKIFPQNWMDFVDVPDRKVYYVEFMGIDTFKIFKLEDYISPFWIDKIRNEDVALMLHCTGHGYHEIAEEIYLNVIMRDKVPPNNVILSSESFDLYTAVEWAAKKHNLPTIRTRVAFEFEAYASHWIRNETGNGDEIFVPTKLEYKDYPKKYVSLNGYYRDHRVAIIFMLAAYNLLDKGFVSYNIKDGGVCGEEALKNLMNRMRSCPEVLDLFLENQEKLNKIDNILLDTEYNQTARNLAVPEENHKNFFHNSYFTILTETNFPEMRRSEYEYRPDILSSNIGRLYSEKIFRCLVFKHPFVATGDKEFLKAFRWLGYKTFSPYIDESYDDEPNHAKRLYMIIQEARRLIDLEGKDLENWLNHVREICEYNFNVLKNKRVFSYDLPIQL